jgi:hypothetical protein
MKIAEKCFIAQWKLVARSSEISGSAVRQSATPIGDAGPPIHLRDFTYSPLPPARLIDLIEVKGCFGGVGHGPAIVAAEV